VEFENGALVFLAENTVLQFYDLSSEDGGLTTRLILRQGSAEFYVSPARGDYFSVTGGDFSVEAESKATFRGGVRYTHGAGRVDGALLVGTTSRDPGIGFTVGYTHVLDAFTPP